MRLNPEGNYNNSTKDSFSGAQKRLVEAWACGFTSIEESALYLGQTKGTVIQTGKTIRHLMYGGPGTDQIAKAVSLAAQNGWLDSVQFPSGDLSRKLTEEEVKVLTFRTLGLSRNEIADKLKIPELVVDKNFEAIHELIGINSDYSAIAWAIIKVLNKNQPTKKLKIN